ncbi:MAG: hypothetical protein MUE61_18810 [Vicinamibacterales bacterium]|jgi:hypothetical protein|nr:hypothetical protein [Vicinamibacterales bacterium]
MHGFTRPNRRLACRWKIVNVGRVTTEHHLARRQRIKLSHRARGAASVDHRAHRAP